MFKVCDELNPRQVWTLMQQVTIARQEKVNTC